jgi:hypothetical protein
MAGIRTPRNLRKDDDSQSDELRTASAASKWIARRLGQKGTLLRCGYFITPLVPITGLFTIFAIFPAFWGSLGALGLALGVLSGKSSIVEGSRKEAGAFMWPAKGALRQNLKGSAGPKWSGAGLDE